MLVLSRKVGEKLVIGDNVTIVVNRVAGNRVTLGIEAPPAVRVIRGELQKPREESPHNVESAPVGDVGRTGGPFELTIDAKDATLLRLAK
jgi:carbon storage regulator